jgi:VWFA-related protein
MRRLLQHRVRCIEALAFAILSAITLAAPTQSLAAQTPQLIPRSHEEREQKFRAEHHAILNVKVTGASGEPLLGLKQSDFTLLDNGRPRTIASLRFIKHGTRLAHPHVLLALDAMNRSARELSQDIKGVRAFLGLGSEPLATQTSIALLTGSGLTVGDASQDRAILLQQLDDMAHEAKPARCEDLVGAPIIPSDIWKNLSTIQNRSSQGPACLNQKFTGSVTSLENLARKEEDTYGRVVVIWIGPGWPQLVGKPFLPDTPQIKDNFFEHLVILTTAMRVGQVTLDSVSALPGKFAAREPDNPFFDGVPDASNMSSQGLSLASLVHQSGGQIQDDGQGIPVAIDNCMKDAENFYVLSFDFPASANPHEFHSLQIKVNRPEAIVRTNTVYYAEP